MCSFSFVWQGKSPEGARRFRPPQAVDSWHDAGNDIVRNATSFGPTCFPAMHSTVVPVYEEFSEDCLFLNVFAPVAPEDRNDHVPSPMPVVIWIHGGGFAMGSGSNKFVSPEPYNMISTARVVYVSMNYRIGPAGFMSHEQLVAEDPTNYGNVGLQDQQLAMRWVQDNIGSFGGDPSQVTIMGESAGAFSICFHLTTSSSFGLFHRAILESSLCDMRFDDQAGAFALGQKLMEAHGCADMDCLRQVPIEKVQFTFETLRGLLFHEGERWFPSVDGGFITGFPFEQMELGHVAPVDVLLGNNANEGSLFVSIAYPVFVHPTIVDELIDGTWHSESQLHMRSFVRDTLSNPDMSSRELVETVFSTLFTCGVRRNAAALALSLARHKDSSAKSVSSVASTLSVDERHDVYLYHFAHLSSAFGFPLNRLGSFHGLELMYVWYIPKGLGTDSERHAARHMMTLFGNFIRTGNPNNFSGAADCIAQEEPHPLLWPHFEVDSTDGSKLHGVVYHFSDDAISMPLESTENVEFHTYVGVPDGISHLVTGEHAFGEANQHPFYHCDVFDAISYDSANYTLALAPYFKEPLSSWLVNFVLVRSIAKLVQNWKITLAIIILAIASCCYCRRRKRKYKST
jgi:para-nitrobenzyl esterase